MSAKGQKDLLTAPLGVIPAGLLDFFFLKSMGENPQRLGEIVQPQMDLFRWYADARATGIFTGSFNPAMPLAANLAASSIDITSTSPTNLCTGNLLIVPATEVWIILEGIVSWGFSAAAGQTASFGLKFSEMLGNGATHLPPMLPRGFTSSLAATNLGGSASMVQPFLAYGDTRIQLLTDGVVVAGATVAASLSMRLLRLQR